MKTEECDIIKDILPSYCDKITSSTTNKLVEKHIQTCEECSNELQNMKKEIESPIIEEEEIDYLKGYRKSKMKAVLVAIVIMILVFEIIILIGTIIVNIKFFVNVEDINITYQGKSINKNTGNKEITFQVFNKKYVIFQQEVRKDIQNKALYIKVIGQYPLVRNGNGCRSFCYVSLDEDVEKIYIEDKKGNTKEIWNQEKGPLTEISHMADSKSRGFHIEIGDEK